MDFCATFWINAQADVHGKPIGFVNLIILYYTNDDKRKQRRQCSAAEWR